MAQDDTCVGNGDLIRVTRLRNGDLLRVTRAWGRRLAQDDTCIGSGEWLRMARWGGGEWLKMIGPGEWRLYYNESGQACQREPAASPSKTSGLAAGAGVNFSS